MAKSKASRPKRKPLPLAAYIRRYGAPKKGTPRRAAYERTAAFKKRSEASRRGREKVATERVLLPILGAFTRAREVGAAHDTIRRKHSTWLKARAATKAVYDERDWWDILDTIGQELGLDEDFIEALDESPDSEEA